MRKPLLLFVLVSIIAALTAGIVAGPAGADAGHVLTIDDVSTAEGNGNATGSVSVSVHVSPAPELGEQVKVDFGTSAQAAQGATAKTTAPGDGTPDFPEDFAQNDGTITFNALETTKTVSVSVLGDNADEADEIFYVQLFNARGVCVIPDTCVTGASIGDTRATVTIIDDDDPPVFSVNNVTSSEGDGPETTAYNFTVKKIGGSGAEVTVDYATADGSATQPGDYTSKSGTLTFAPSSPSSQETQTVGVDVKGDTTFESSESFTVNLSDVSNATISDAEGLGTITNDDDPPPPSASVSNGSGTEGNTVGFVVRLSSPPGPGQTGTVDWALEATEDEGSATEGADYADAVGSVLFTAGESEQTVVVPTLEDVTHEIGETFDFRLSEPDTPGTGGYTYTVAQDLASGTIVDDDAAPTLSVDDVTVDVEGSTDETKTATFTVTKSGLTDYAAAVHVATADGTAVSGGDYTASSGDLSFGPEETEKEFSVQTKGDVVDEIAETFSVVLSVPSEATLADGTGTGTITDDDAASASFSISDVNVTEGNSGTKAATFTVTKTGETGQLTAVAYATADSAAKKELDYNEKSGAIGFGPAVTTKTITVDVRGDTLDEVNEGFFVNLSSPTNATIGDGQALGLIIDNDAPPTIALSNGSVKELSTNSCNLTVKLSAVSGREINVHYATATGTAGSSDFLAKTGDLKFLPGESAKVIKVYARSDSAKEGTETFSVKLSGISPLATATFADGTGACSILDND